MLLLSYGLPLLLLFHLCGPSPPPSVCCCSDNVQHFPGSKSFPLWAAASTAAQKGRPRQPAAASLWRRLLGAFRPTNTLAAMSCVSCISPPASGSVWRALSRVCRLACCLSVNTLSLAVRFWQCPKRRHCGIIAACSHQFRPEQQPCFTLADRPILAGGHRQRMELLGESGTFYTISVKVSL